MICPYCIEFVGRADNGSYFDPWNNDLGKVKPCPHCKFLVKMVSEDWPDANDGKIETVYLLQKAESYE